MGILSLYKMYLLNYSNIYNIKTLRSLDYGSVWFEEC